MQYKHPAGPDKEFVVELAVNPALFRERFEAQLPPETTAPTAATERPTAVTAFSEASGPLPWKKLPRAGMEERRPATRPPASMLTRV